MAVPASTTLRIFQQCAKPVVVQVMGTSERGVHYAAAFRLPEMTNKCKMCGMPALPGVAQIHTQQKQDKNADIDKEVKDTLDHVRKGNFEKIKVTNPEDLQHFRPSQRREVKEIKTKEGDMINSMAPVPKDHLPMGSVALPHPIWSEDELHSVDITHKSPVGITDRLAFWTVKGLRGVFDILSGFNRKPRDEHVWVNRICFLETVAGVPGMVAAMVRHLHSLRRMRRDHGWIHTLLEEAENERMHLMTALQLKQPSMAFRWAVVIAQGGMVSYFSLAYMVSPKYCHRLVGYLEEEAVITYTKCLKDIENGTMQHWKTQPAPEVATTYWKLAPDATMKDVILAIRADEAHHRVVNHTLASMKSDDYNPYKPGK